MIQTLAATAAVILLALGIFSFALVLIAAFISRDEHTPPTEHDEW